MTWTAYGLHFVSESLALPELSPHAGDPEPGSTIEITIGHVPDRLAEPGASGVLYEASADEFLLRVPDVADYHVTSDRIAIKPSSAAGEDEVRVFMLGSAFGALLHLRGLLVLHAAAFYVPMDQGQGGAVLISGMSGAGKSTLLGEFLSRGYEMIVDDVCAVELVDGVATVLPGYPRTRLWADAAAKLEVATDDLTRTRPDLEKFERQIPEQFHDRSARLDRLYILAAPHSDAVAIEPVSTMDAFGALLANTYRRTFLEGLAMREEHFALTSAAARQVPVARVTRPDDRFALAELADAIEADIAASAAV